MEPALLQQVLEALRDLKLPSRELLISIIDASRRLHRLEENVLHLTGEYAIVGDLHGHFLDFLNMIDMIGQDTGIVFLGDYVDRGFNSVELIIYLLVSKVMNPHRIVLLRGNHENRSQTAVYGFQEECLSKYDHYVYWKLCEAFGLLPVAVIVNSEYFCVHGGISPGLSVEWISRQDRVVEYGEISCILWGDPTDEVATFESSQRGAGYLYGSAAVEGFLRRVGCEYLVRSHQLVADGYEEKFGGKCITVWSAPNYCYKCKNAASFMLIGGNTHKFVVFEALETQYRES